MTDARYRPSTRMMSAYSAAPHRYHLRADQLGLIPLIVFTESNRVLFLQTSASEQESNLPLWTWPESNPRSPLRPVEEHTNPNLP